VHVDVHTLDLAVDFEADLGYINSAMAGEGLCSTTHSLAGHVDCRVREEASHAIV
jgi:hypothetical protein